jgi:CheY-like chemotaxis protein
MKKILAIDDSKFQANTIKHLLESNEFIVETITSLGHEIYERLKKANYCLIILDLIMPHISGIEIYKFMKVDIELSKIPVIILTARTDLLNKYPELHGANKFMSKPFDHIELVSAVTTLTGK